MRPGRNARSTTLRDDREYQRIKLHLALAARRWRRRSRMSQGELARRLALTPAVAAGLESGDSAASLDLLIRSLLALGATQRDIALEIVRNT